MSRIAILLVIGTAVLASSFFLWQEWSLEKGEWGFPLDDAWIHCRFAQNLAAGQGFSFNPGEPTPGSTSPLWVILLAGLSRATGRFVFSSVSLGILFYLLSVYLSYRLALLVIPDRIVATAVALLVALSGRFLWGSLSGMEVSLFTFLALAGLYFHVRGVGSIKNGYSARCFWAWRQMPVPKDISSSLSVSSTVSSPRSAFVLAGTQARCGSGWL